MVVDGHAGTDRTTQGDSTSQTTHNMVSRFLRLLHGFACVQLLLAKGTEMDYSSLGSRERVVCARAAGQRDGLSSKAVRDDGKTFLYLTPTNATIMSQRHALSVAIAIANRTRSILRLPRFGYVRRKQVPFCELFDSKGLRQQEYASSVSRSWAEQVCGKRMLSPAHLAGADLSLSCVSFDALLAEPRPARLVHVCAERKLHRACTRSRKVATSDSSSSDANSHRGAPVGSSSSSKKSTWPNMNALPSSVMHMLSSVAKEGTPPIRTLRPPKQSHRKGARSSRGSKL